MTDGPQNGEARLAGPASEPPGSTEAREDTGGAAAATTDTTRARALELLGKGMATLSECAALARVSRQCARYWALKAGVDAAGARARYLRGLWRRGG